MHPLRTHLLQLLLALALTAFVTISCAHPGAGNHVQYFEVEAFSVEASPPELHHAWGYLMARNCTQNDAWDFEDLTWFRAARVAPGRAASVPTRGWIYLQHDVWLEPRFIAHEVLHVLLPDARHTDPEFAACDPLRRSANNP